MSTYKKLNKQDAYITTYTAHKPWAVSGYDVMTNTYGIKVDTAGNGYTYEGLRQLYYRTKDSDGTIPSHSFDLYDQTTLFSSGSRNLIYKSQIISIPRQLYGVSIKPGTFKITVPASGRYLLAAVAVDYVKEGYVQDTPTVYVVNPKGDANSKVYVPLGPPYYDAYVTVTIADDAEGRLYRVGTTPRVYVGDIIYTHGMAIVTNPSYIGLVNGAFTSRETAKRSTLAWQSSQPIFTHNYHCKIRESENNYTYNSTALSASIRDTYDNNGDSYKTSALVQDGYRNNNVTGSAFQPYITTVGLYNDANQLIAVGKMGQPVPKSANTEMTIIVKIDI